MCGVWKCESVKVTKVCSFWKPTVKTIENEQWNQVMFTYPELSFIRKLKGLGHGVNKTANSPVSPVFHTEATVI